MNIILPLPNNTHTTFDSLSSKDITFEDKSSSVHLDGVLNRHQDIPAMRVIHRTPTFVPHYGVLANARTPQQLQITDSIFFTEKKKNIIIDGIFTKILYSTLHFTMAGLYIHFQLCSKFSTDGLSPHENKPSKDNPAHKTYIQFNPSNEPNRFQIESICEIETRILQLYSQTQLIHHTKNPVYGLKTQLYSGSIRSHSARTPTSKQEQGETTFSFAKGVRGIDGGLIPTKGMSGWRPETLSRLTSEDLYCIIPGEPTVGGSKVNCSIPGEPTVGGSKVNSQGNVLTKYIKISGVWETDLSYGITYKVFTE